LLGRLAEHLVGDLIGDERRRVGAGGDVVVGHGPASSFRDTGRTVPCRGSVSPERRSAGSGRSWKWGGRTAAPLRRSPGAAAAGRRTPRGAGRRPPPSPLPSPPSGGRRAPRGASWSPRPGSA